MLWSVMPSTGACVLTPLSSSPGSSSGATDTSAVQIEKPVGRGPLARNLPADVLAIQQALNQVTVLGAAGGPMPFLVEDGICGPKTNAAIVRFQQVQLKFFDGLIEPNKMTIAKLNEIIDPVSDEDLRARLRLALPLVADAITATLANLSALIASGPAPSGPAALAADRLNRHFRLDTLSASDKGTARLNLFRTFTRFGAVMVDTAAINIDAIDEFDLDKNNPKIALTRGKGFFDDGVIDEETQLPADRIHLGLGFFAKKVTPEFGAFIILHELAHFVGDADGRFIVDNGRGWFDDTFIRPLSADQRLTNADSYASFAHECRVRSPAKPGFVQTAPGGRGGTR